MGKKLILLLSFVMVFQFFGGNSVGAKSVKDLQKQKNELQQKIKARKVEIKKIKAERSIVAGEIEKLDREVDDASNAISNLQFEIKKLDGRISDNEIILENTIIELNNNMDLFGEKLNVMQKTPDYSSLELLLSAKNLSDYLTRKSFVIALAQQDYKLIDSIKNDRAKIEETKFLLSKQRDYTLQKKDELVFQKEKLVIATRAKQDLMRRLDSDKAKLEESLNQFNEAANALTKKILELQKPSNSKYVGGKLAWPLPGREKLSSPFGNRIHPILGKNMFHSGVDIPAPSGTPIKVSGTGTVIHAGWYSSYGKMVMVDHGGGIVTLYGHCSSILVQNGAKVSTGQKIALVGSTGRSTGPHLHFEVRKDGKFQNPIGWVSP